MKNIVIALSLFLLIVTSCVVTAFDFITNDTNQPFKMCHQNCEYLIMKKNSEILKQGIIDLTPNKNCAICEERDSLSAKQQFDSLYLELKHKYENEGT